MSKILDRLGVTKVMTIIKTDLSKKVDKVAGKDLSTNDYTNDDKNRLAIALTYRGVKATIDQLPSSGNMQGDMWRVSEDNGDYYWNGTTWLRLGTEEELEALTDAEIQQIWDGI